MFKLTVIIIGLLILTAPIYAYDDEDFQVWNTDTEEFKINKDMKATLEEEFRWADNADEFYYHHYDAGMNYACNKQLSLGGGYRHIYELKKGKFKQENAPYIVATLSGESKGFSLESRNRVEYRHFDYQPDSWRYRNKFTLRAPWKFTKIEIQPFVSDEILASFASGTNQLNQNRISCGIGMQLLKSLKAEAYYMRVSSKSSGKWSDVNVLGTKIKLLF